MSVLTVQPLAFRCSKCWQMTCAGSDQVGSSVPCVSCSTQIAVPAATPQLLEAGEEFVASYDSISPAQLDLDEELSKEQICELASEKIRQHQRESGSLTTLASSRWKRLLGAIIDGAVASASAILGIIVLAIMGPDGGLPVVIAAITVPLMLILCQGYMIAVDGRTIGKYCVNSKIVNEDGNPPGFFKGIFMRIVVVNILGIIPGFGLFNVCWIFQNESKRCLHDYIAGTFVIDA